MNRRESEEGREARREVWVRRGKGKKERKRRGREKHGRRRLGEKGREIKQSK